MARLAERADAWINPLMLKETYQGFRSGALRMVAALALIAPLAIIGAFIGAGAFENSEIDDAGRNLFQGLIGVLTLLGGLIAPARAAMQLHGEIKSHTLDLIQLTSLSPWQLAFGRFQAAVLQVVLLFSLALPFAIACVSIGGVSVGYVVEAIIVMFGITLVQCSATLAGATVMLVSTQLGNVTTFVALVHGMVYTPLLGVSMRGVLSGATSVWLSILLGLYTLLFLRVAADMLTPSAIRSFTLSKACLAAFLAVFFMPLWLGRIEIAAVEARFILLGVGLALLYVFGIAWTATRERRSAGTPAWRLLLDDGYDATACYCAVITGAVASVAAVRGWPAALPVLCFVYFVFITGFAVLVHALLPASARTTVAYLQTLAGLVVFEFAGTLFCEGLRNAPGSSGLLHALGMVFPLGLSDPRFTAETLPWFLVPLLIGVASIALARKLNAERAHG